MAPEEIDDEGNFWFLSAVDSHKNKEILEYPSLQMLFQGYSYSGFLSIYIECKMVGAANSIGWTAVPVPIRF
jgi:general stress protein 26